MNLTELKDKCELSGGCRSPVYHCGTCPFRPENVVNLADYRAPGNGGREIVERYFAEFMEESPVPIADVIRADHFLLWLWGEGFKVVPLDGGDC